VKKQEPYLTETSVSPCVALAKKFVDIIGASVVLLLASPLLLVMAP
jgi:lipopolysaccharide/colanic/teichoic acid biosynthesis glycosyltransferase